MGAERVVVLDFETSGMSPPKGDRAIEVGAVLIEGGQIVDSFQSLMNSGRRVDGFIENFTGITNAMLQDAPKAEVVMDDFYRFIADYPLVAHNASFDRRFLDSELQLIGKKRQQQFSCSLLVARRLYPDAPNHKLGTLVQYKNIPHNGTFHRALADAEMTAHLWLEMVEEMKRICNRDHVPFALLAGLAKQKIPKIAAYMKKITAGVI